MANIFKTAAEGSVYHSLLHHSMSNESFTTLDIALDRVMTRQHEAVIYYYSTILKYSQYHCKASLSK